MPDLPAPWWPRDCPRAGGIACCCWRPDRDTNPWIHIPLGFAKTNVDARVNWKFESAPQPQLNNRQIYVPRGKTLGGTSSINGMVYMRGHPRDYDGWRQRGSLAQPDGKLMQALITLVQG